jgi:hypothetical protein
VGDLQGVAAAIIVTFCKEKRKNEVTSYDPLVLDRAGLENFGGCFAAYSTYATLKLNRPISGKRWEA